MNGLLQFFCYFENKDLQEILLAKYSLKSEFEYPIDLNELIIWFSN